MIGLQIRPEVGQASVSLMTDIRDLQLVQTDEGVFAVSTTGRNGGLVSYRLQHGAAAALHDTQSFGGSVATTLNGNLFRFTAGPQDVLLIGDAADVGALGYAFTEAGRFSALVQLDGLNAGAGAVSALYDSGAGFVFMSEAGAAAFGCYVPDGRGGFSLEAQITDTVTTYARDVVALRGGVVNGQQIVLAASGAEAGISSYRLNPASGALSAQGSLGAADGFGILANITGLEMITAYGRCYAIVASAAAEGEGGALSVLEVLSSGALMARDHLLDTRETRFGQVQSLTVVEADGRVYVLAGGGDDGLSLLVLLPDGRLQHLDSLADSGGATSLANVSAIVATQLGNEMQVLVAGQGDEGLIQLVFSLGTQGETLRASAGGGTLTGAGQDDILAGGTGADTLTGGAGDDILADGRGQDVLTGGAGEDVFVLHGDDSYDRITDFEPGRDALDLSDFPMFYDPALLEIETTSTGAIIRWKGIETDVVRADGGGLSAGQIRLAVLAGPDRPLLVLNADGEGSREDLILMGSMAADVLQGQLGADVIHGLGGNDGLDGGGGHDTLYGGNGRDRVNMGGGNDVFYDNTQGGAFGRDTVLGEAGNDTIIGGNGDDAFHGQDGSDRVSGGRGADLLSGGTGNDSLSGQDGADTIWGGTGQDTLRGGNQGDRLYGKDGNDVLFGGNGRDTVFGGDGKDTVLGDGGHDVVYGQGGNDLLIGGRGNDKLFAGNGNDELQGGSGHDTLAGGIGRDKAYMGDGNDKWFDHAQSGGGNDYVEGGNGNDTLQGGGGNDTLSGGAGADVFVFAASIDDDVITDYEVGVDRLQFSSTLWAGALSQSELLARTAVVAGDLLFSFDTGDTLRLDGVATLAGVLDDISLI